MTEDDTFKRLCRLEFTELLNRIHVAPFGSSVVDLLKGTGWTASEYDTALDEYLTEQLKKIDGASNFLKIYERDFPCE